MRGFRRATRQDGFTLPEVLVTIVILGVITFALALAVITALQNEQATQKKVVASYDAQLVSMHLPSDVHSASSVIFSPTSNTECSGASNLLRLRWTEQVTSAAAVVTYTAAYRIENTGGEWRLVRYFCDSSVGGGAPSSLVVAHDLKPSCAAPDCQVTSSGSTISVKLTASTGYVYTVTGTRRAP